MRPAAVADALGTGEVYGSSTVEEDRRNLNEVADAEDILRERDACGVRTM